MAKNSVKANALGTLDTATLVAGVPQPISGAFAGAPCIIRVVNRSNISVSISYAPDVSTATTARDIVSPLGELTLQLATNSIPNNHTALMPKGWFVWGQAAAPGIGNIYATCYYQEAS